MVLQRLSELLIEMAHAVLLNSNRVLKGMRPKEAQGHQSISTQCKPLSKQSNGNIRTESLNHGNKQSNPVQPSSKLLNNGGVIPNAQPSKHIAFNHDGGRSHLSHAQVDILVDTVLRNHPKEVHQYRSSEKKELIIFYLAEVAMGICKRKAEPSMLNMVLREKLDEITLVTTKENVQREGTRNGRNVGP
ncbi:hypothetical protein Cgig2_029745 [Carnegiea gigantea]|uniref:Uncharacterized protein n=1 Tax=Carnegiea gigantea TaxID=171969 RepID=A0A9Q1QAF1_9CARY|nr:hypothetical protein Cgig2_029745 [Carnegiea gigantea]